MRGSVPTLRGTVKATVRSQARREGTMTYQLSANRFSSHRPIGYLAGPIQSYAVHYHPGMINHCPGCAGTQWLVGRVMAQCARCDTALPLSRVAETPMRPLFVSRGYPGTRAA